MYSDGVQKNQITPLTGLRWVAALFVYLSHTIKDDDLPQSLLQFSGNGYCGVTIFFILSAFILTVNYHNRLGIRDLFKYFIARAARILPIYYVIFIFVLLKTKLRYGSIPSWSWIHLLLIQGWSSNKDVSMGLIGPAWSVGVEIFFYLLFPILLFMFSKKLKNVQMSGSLVIVGVVLITLFYFRFRNGDSHRWLYRFPLTRSGDFIYGIGLAGIYLSISKVKKFPLLASVMTYISIGFIVSMMYFTRPFSAISWDLLYAVPAGTLILGLAINQTSYIARLLGSKVFVRLGEISFTFYLIHTLGFDNSLKNTTAFAILYYLLNIAVVCAVGYSLYQFIEKPSRIYINSRLKTR